MGDSFGWWELGLREICVCLEAKPFPPSAQGCIWRRRTKGHQTGLLKVTQEVSLVLGLIIVWWWLKVCEIGSVSSCMAALLSEKGLGDVQEGMHLQCLSLVGRRTLQVRRAQLGTEEPLPAHSTKFHQSGGSRQAAVILCQCCGGLAPLTEVSVTQSQGCSGMPGGRCLVWWVNGGTRDSSDFLCSDLGWLSAAHPVSLPHQGLLSSYLFTLVKFHFSDD